MKRIISIVVLFFYLFSFQSPIYAASSTKDGYVYDSLEKDKKETSKPEKKVSNVKSTSKSEKNDSSNQLTSDSQTPSLFISFIKFIFSFLLVIGLLFLVLRYLAQRNRLMPSNGPILSLGGQTLGNNKSLQILLIGQTIYVVGVGDSITLMRTISQGEEYQNLLESFENQIQSDGLSPKWFPVDTKKIWNLLFRKDQQNMQPDLNAFENQSMSESYAKNSFPINSKKFWNSLFRKDLQNMQHELDSLDKQDLEENLSQKWIPTDAKKSWDSVFQKQLQKMKHENEEE